jgi:hypothetical protein
MDPIRRLMGLPENRGVRIAWRDKVQQEAHDPGVRVGQGTGDRWQRLNKRIKIALQLRRKGLLFSQSAQNRQFGTETCHELEVKWIGFCPESKSLSKVPGKIDLPSVVAYLKRPLNRLPRL